MNRFKVLAIKGAAKVAMTSPVTALLARGVRKGDAAGLDKQVAAVLAVEKLMRLPPLDSMDPARARKHAESGLSPLDLKPAPMASIEDITVPGPAGPIPVRVYTPHQATKHWLVYLHGGGGVIGSIRSSDAAVRYLAQQTGCTVASVEYRLGPEYKHPAAIDDAVAAFDALASRVPTGGKLAVGGDSFGGYLAAHVDNLATHRPALQVLLYPIVDQELVSPSIDRHATGYLLTKTIIHWFRDHYLKPTDDRRAASPRYFPTLAKAAPAIVATAGYDPLVDEGDAYAAALRTAGVTVRHRRYPGLIHGFLSLAGAVRAARAATDEVCSDIRALLGP